MSELKVYHCNEWHNHYTEFYLKSEADKVIADLKKACNDKDDWCLHTLKENCHHKHKIEVEQLLIEIAELKKENAELKEERRWRKFPDEKPEEDTKVLVLVDILPKKGKSRQIDKYTREDGFASTRVPRFRTYGDFVTHWMPLPAAPKEQA